MSSLSMGSGIKNRLRSTDSRITPSQNDQTGTSESMTKSRTKTSSSLFVPSIKPINDFSEHIELQSADISAASLSLLAPRSSLHITAPNVRLSTTSLSLPKLAANILTSSSSSSLPFSLLLSLPKDIIIELCMQYIDFNTLLALRATCHAFYKVLPSHLLTRIRNTITSTLIASESSQLSAYRLSHPRQPYSHLWDLFYAAFEWQLQERPSSNLICYGCLETKPLSAFVERMSSRGTGLGGSSAQHRRCKDCMRRYISIGGVWWREHWVRKSDTRRRRGRAERWARWMTRGERLVKVRKGEEVGVCRVCGMGGEELYWGCGGCFDKEEERKRREYWEESGLAHWDDVEERDLDDATSLSAVASRGGANEGLTKFDRLAKWLIEKLYEKLYENRSHREKKRRRKVARRREGGGRWYRRVIRGSVSWEGSWEGRVEALVEYMNGKDVKGIDDSNLEGNAPDESVMVTTRDEWKALDQVPLRKDRREARCNSCWMPSCFKKTYMVGLAYEKGLPFDRWCEDCQQEQKEKEAKKQRVVVTDAELDEAVEAVRDLFL